MPPASPYPGHPATFSPLSAFCTGTGTGPSIARDKGLLHKRPKHFSAATAQKSNSKTSGLDVETVRNDQISHVKHVRPCL